MFIMHKLFEAGIKSRIPVEKLIVNSNLIFIVKMSKYKREDLSVRYELSGQASCGNVLFPGLRGSNI